MLSREEFACSAKTLKADKLASEECIKRQANVPSESRRQSAVHCASCRAPPPLRDTLREERQFWEPQESAGDHLLMVQ